MIAHWQWSARRGATKKFTNKEDVWKESLVGAHYGRSITNRQTLDTPVALSME